ncbi:MAG TPA: tyrosine recombinase XerC [Steroidobacteraceae bacterium]|nr:tyrosine recombinase XerC [Steroidobacteraceae bacterium]
MSPQALAWLARFRRYLLTERRLAARTDEGYARDLDALVRFCDAHGITGWEGLDGQHVRQFAAQSHARGLGPRSIQRRLSAVRTFFRFLVRERAAKSNPGEDIHAPKPARRLPGTLDPDQMARLLELPGDGMLVARDRAIMELLYSSGLRLAELVALDTADLKVNDRTVRVLGKGGKVRIVPVGRAAAQALAAWASARACVAGADTAALFVGRGGRRLGRRAVEARVAYWARRQGLAMSVYPHLFRHSFASHLLESSGDLRAVQELLGHADVSTTQIYTHLDFQHLARIYDATHPRARRKA